MKVIKRDGSRRYCSRQKIKIIAALLRLLTRMWQRKSGIPERNRDVRTISQEDQGCEALGRVSVSRKSRTW